MRTPASILSPTFLSTLRQYSKARCSLVDLADLEDDSGVS